MQKQSIRLSVILIVLALLIGAVSYLRLLDTYEFVLLDLRFQSRPLQKINPRIAIIEIADDTLENLGKWPLPRDYHATLIKVLADCGVKAVIFDVLFSEPTKEDALLLAATKRAGCVYYPYALSLKTKNQGLWQAETFEAELLPQLAEAARGKGHANVITDSDGKRRRIPLFIDYQGRLMPQLTLKAACDYLNISPGEVNLAAGKFLELGKSIRIPVDEETAALVNLAGRWKDTFKHYSYYDILTAYAESNQGEKPSALLAQLKDKVCFVGLTATGTADINATALEPVYPMVGLHANLLNSILTNSFLNRVSRPLNLGILFLLCLLNIVFALKTKPPLSILYRLGILILFVAAGFLLFLIFGLWIDLFFPIIVYLLVYLGFNLFRYIRELRRRELIEKELSIARNIQRSFLKEEPPKIGRADIAVAMDTARHVGGDLYDFVQLADGRIGLMVGDVSGKGVPAALFMAQVISQFRSFAGTCSTPAQTLTKLNQEISRSSKSGLFVTVTYLIYDPATLKVSLASGGHLPPLVFRKGKLLEKIEVKEGIPLGLMEGADFSQTEVQLQPKDLVLLYTDGITEARDKRGRDFGEEGIIRTLQDKPDLSSKQAVQHLQSAIDAFTHRLLQHDDITILTLTVS